MCLTTPTPMSVSTIKPGQKAAADEIRSRLPATLPWINNRLELERLVNSKIRVWELCRDAAHDASIFGFPEEKLDELKILFKQSGLQCFTKEKFGICQYTPESETKIKVCIVQKDTDVQTYVCVHASGEVLECK